MNEQSKLNCAAAVVVNERRVAVSAAIEKTLGAVPSSRNDRNRNKGSVLDVIALYLRC